MSEMFSYSVLDFCCICFCKEHLLHLSDSDSDNITYYTKLISCVSEMYFNEMNDQLHICNKCCESMEAAYIFRQRCLRSKTMLTDYISQLHQVSNIINIANVIKSEKILNLNKDTNENEYSETNLVTDIKNQNSPFSSKLIDNAHNYVHYDNVVVKMEQENSYLEEHIPKSFDNLLVNQDRIKFDVSQNDIKLMSSAIKKENVNQDSDRHLKIRFDNITKTYDSKILNTEIKIEENYDYSVYSEKCADNPLLNLDEIKIDIVDNDIKSVNDRINIYYKTDKHDILLKSEDKIDKDASSLFTAMKDTSTSKSSKLQNIYNQKIRNTRSNTITYSESKPFECNLCEKKFSIAAYLRQHMITHSGVKAFECSECQKKFARSVNLREHKKIHSREKPHECSVCQKKFRELSNLKRHMRIHIIGLYECNVCQKRFTNSTNLKIHIKIHTGIKPHGCSVCQKRFIRAFSLKEHMRIHTGERPHECAVCQKKFTDLSNLKRHTRIHSRDNPQDNSIEQIQLGPVFQSSFKL